MIRKLIVIVIVLTALNFQSEAQCPAESVLFFANGMFNSKESAQNSLTALKNRIKETPNWTRDRSELAYNYDEAAAYQLSVGCRHLRS